MSKSSVSTIGHGRKARTTEQVQGLAITVGGDAHVADEHAENPFRRAFVQCSIPTGFVAQISAPNQRPRHARAHPDGNQVFSVIVKNTRHLLSKP
jgi:hypothetical protein